MADTEVRICSNARLMLGKESINTFAEDTTNLCESLWDDVRRGTLEMANWQCCRKRVVLPRLVTVPEFDFQFKFKLPSDFVRLVRFGDRGQFFDYEIEDGELLCDEESISIVYIFDQRNPAAFNPLLTLALTWHMAWIMAYPLTASNTTKEEMESGLNGVLKIARGVNHAQTPSEVMGDSPLLTSRFSRRGFR